MVYGKQVLTKSVRKHTEVAISILIFWDNYICELFIEWTCHNTWAIGEELGLNGEVPLEGKMHLTKYYIMYGQSYSVLPIL